MERFTISISNDSNTGYEDIYTDPPGNMNFHPSETMFTSTYSAQHVKIHRRHNIISICEVQLFSGKCGLF